jgi:dihydrofolate synthase/folylpolyglutamate synthase
VATSWTLAELGMPLTEAALRHGLAAVIWPGRLEVLPAPVDWEPTVVVDGAHTEASAALLVAALEGYFPGRPCWLVLGVSSDKSVDALLGRLAPLATRVIGTQSRHPRALPVHDLVLAARSCMSPSIVTGAPTVAAALVQALQEAPSDAVVCFAGSLFVAAEAREAWLERHPRAFPPGDWAYEAEPPDPAWQVPQAR